MNHCTANHFCPISTSVHHCTTVVLTLEQGRQDLNLQPAVLETAALPFELRPFSSYTPRTAHRDHR